MKYVITGYFRVLTVRKICLIVICWRRAFYKSRLNVKDISNDGFVFQQRKETITSDITSYTARSFWVFFQNCLKYVHWYKKRKPKQLLRKIVNSLTDIHQWKYKYLFNSFYLCKLVHYELNSCLYFPFSSKQKVLSM